jgi:hypothetical protein
MKRLNAAAATLLTVAALAGCQNNKSTADSSPNSPKPVGAPTATPPRTDATLLKSGPAPISYLLGPGGNIRLVDTTTNKEVAKAMVPPQTAITLDPKKGLLVGTKTITPGPLPDGHTYEIWLLK